MEIINIIKVSVREKLIIETAWNCMKNRQLISLWYDSKSKGYCSRKIRPYMICINTRGNLELVGVPEEEWGKPQSDLQAAHYLLSKLNLDKIKTLPDTFDDPGVPRKIVVDISAPVICRFIYDDEDREDVMKSWVKVEGLNLK
jgi:hypothetical protein